MRFTKMQGTGNDFVCVDCSEEKIGHPHRLARKLCDRHYGIGADGALFLYPSAWADCRMEIYNCDGSAAGMCGNGLRCAGAYLWKYRFPGKQELIIETRSGRKRLWREGSLCCADMERPSLQPHALPVLAEGQTVIEEPFWAEGEEIFLTCLSMGNPHGVCFVEDVKKAEVERLGRALEHHRRFPEGVNIEFAQMLGKQQIAARVWERGCGETLSCGTGACACAAAAVLTGRCKAGEEIRIELPGGTLFARWDGAGPVYLKGPAEEVFSGEIVT